MPKLDLFICLAFLVLIRLSSQFDCELCYDGRVDASFSFENQLVVFKGKALYVYKALENDDDPAPLQMDIENVGISVYDKLLNNKTFGLEFHNKVSFSELCSSDLSDLKFDYIQTAFYDEPNQRVTLIENTNQNVIEFNVSTGLSEFKSLQCSSRSFIEFSNSNNLTFNPNQILFFDGTYLFFERELFYLYDTQQLGLHEFRPKNKHNEPVGPMPVRLLDADFPPDSTGIVHLQNEVWLFKANRIFKMNEHQLRNKLSEYSRFLSAKKGMGAVCKHDKFRSISMSIIRIIYDIREKPFSLERLARSSSLRKVSSLDEFGCSSSGEDCILTSSGLFYYLTYHLGWLFFLLFLLIWPITALLAYLWEKHNEDDDFYIVDETQHKVRLASNQKIPTLSRQDEMRKRMYPQHPAGPSSQRKADDSDEEVEEVTPINLPIEKPKSFRGVTERFGKLFDGIKKGEHRPKNPEKARSSFYPKNLSEQQETDEPEENSPKPSETDRSKYSERNVD